MLYPTLEKKGLGQTPSEPGLWALQEKCLFPGFLLPRLDTQSGAAHTVAGAKARTPGPGVEGSEILAGTRE